jgi:uncharacterized protein YdeI (BOF family)
MKKLVIIALSVCLCSCASSRFSFATPKSDPSVYLEKPLSNVLAGNFTGEEAYKEEFVGYGDNERMFKYFHFVSPVNIVPTNNDNRYIFSDNAGNSVNVETSLGGFYNIYQLSDNYDFRPEKFYNIKYTARVDNISQQLEIISIDSIEGLLTYKEYKEQEE